ncbi:hypothetical protein OnM2_c2315o135 [Erysiphe neolycopersici]|uniref:Secreted protein n=1 Tax=Erysiphe neolycopersici TaxID=212602 RepID=A0A420I0G6_9PEZI|nr:hypothetical protein OnM2_c2315o135 [Erysiphe neolycopersici]
MPFIRCILRFSIFIFIRVASCRPSVIWPLTPRNFWRMALDKFSGKKIVSRELPGNKSRKFVPSIATEPDSIACLADPPPEESSSSS